MDINKTEEINSLLELYGELLTKKQRTVMNMYYVLDYSLSEIAENTKTSRAAVYDLIKRVNNTLKKYEKKLHLLEKRKKIVKLIERLPNKTKKEIEELI